MLIVSTSQVEYEFQLEFIELLTPKSKTSVRNQKFVEDCNK